MNSTITLKTAMFGSPSELLKCFRENYDFSFGPKQGFVYPIQMRPKGAHTNEPQRNVYITLNAHTLVLQRYKDQKWLSIIPNSPLDPEYTNRERNEII